MASTGQKGRAFGVVNKVGQLLVCAVMFCTTGIGAKTVSKPVTSEARPQQTVTVEAQPKWVVPVQPDYAPTDTTAPLYYALLDKQVKVDASGVSGYERLVRVLRQSSGLEVGSQIQIEYDPSYQQLVLHQLEVWRNGKRIDKLKTQKFKILQRETQLERLVYDGRATASLVLDDVRVGDRIEYAYTLKGQNPVFGGRFVEMDWSVASSSPVALYQLRVVSPMARPIRYKVKEGVFQTTVRELGDQREVILQRRNSPQWVFDPSAPSFAYLGDLVQWSEFSDWADVARWASQLFEQAAVPSPQVREQLERLIAGASNDEERVRRVLDFVQTEVRYFGTEIGVNSHLPATASTVLKQRYGDCKDKAALLVALMKAMGVSASPVLVSNAYRDRVSGLLPSPLAFDHAIVQARVGDQTYLLDGTRGRQTGALRYRSAQGLGQILLADKDQTGLTTTPGTAQVVRAEGRDVFHFVKVSEPPVLTTSITYYGEVAETVRNMLASQSLAEMQKSQQGTYVRFYPRIVVLEPLKVVEDAERNALTLTAKYSVPDYWRFPQQKALVGDFALVSLIEPLQLASQAPRTRPLYFSLQGIFRHQVIYEFEEDVLDGPASNRFDERNAFFDLHQDMEGSARGYRITGELQQLTNTIEVEDWTPYKDALTKIWPRLGNVMVIPALNGVRYEAFKRAFQQASDDFNRGRSSLKSTVQFQSQVRSMYLKSVLDAGRLPAKLRAEALVELGTQQDRLGLFAEAHQNFDEAIRLDPSYPAAHAGLAVNAIERFDFEAADRASAMALKLDPNDNSTRLSRAQALFHQGRYAQAREVLIDLLKSRSQVEESYGALWLYLTTRKMGEDGVAAVKPYMPVGSRPAWPYPVLQSLTGNLSYDEAVRAATDAGKPDPAKLCELYYFSGMKELLAGDARSAKAYFKQSVGTGIVEYMEYGFARHQLLLLDK